MRKILLALLLGLLAATPASAQKSKAAIQTEITSFFGDNSTGLITPAKLRTVTTDLLNSYVDWLTCVGSGGLVYWSAGTPTCLSAGTTGQVLRTNGTVPSWADVSSNILAGTGITITGTSPATISITNQLVAGSSVADGVNLPVLTYNAQGQLTAVSTAAITPPFTAVTGIAALTQGGTNANLTASNGGIVWSNATQMQILAGTATARFPLLSGATAAPTWGTIQYPASATSGGVACFTSATAMGSSVAMTANAIMLGGGAGVCPGVLGSLGTTTTLLHGNAAGAPSFGSLVFGDIAAAALATSANLEAGAASTLLSAPIIYDPEVTVTFAASQTLDFNTFLNARITATANTTSLTCSNIKASQSGVITWVQDGTGSRTMVAGWCSQFRWTGGTRGVLSTAAASVDALFYQCVSTSICYVSLGKAQAN